MTHGSVPGPGGPDGSRTRAPYKGRPWSIECQWAMGRRPPATHRTRVGATGASPVDPPSHPARSRSPPPLPRRAGGCRGLTRVTHACPPTGDGGDRQGTDGRWASHWPAPVTPCRGNACVSRSRRRPGCVPISGPAGSGTHPPRDTMG